MPNDCNVHTLIRLRGGGSPGFWGLAVSLHLTGADLQQFICCGERVDRQSGLT